MGDIPDWCCAAGVCCDMDKQRKALVRLFVERADLTADAAGRVADLLMENVDMLPKAAGLRQVITYVQAHPYK